MTKRINRVQAAALVALTHQYGSVDVLDETHDRGLVVSVYEPSGPTCVIISKFTGEWEKRS